MLGPRSREVRYCAYQVVVLPTPPPKPSIGYRQMLSVATSRCILLIGEGGREIRACSDVSKRFPCTYIIVGIDVRERIQLLFVIFRGQVYGIELKVEYGVWMVRTVLFRGKGGVGREQEVREVRLVMG